jgi:ribonuclease G
MARNILVINVDLRETRVALIENGVIAELTVERAAHRGSVGNIVLGKVTRVLPGMQAAFIDIGMERAAFLHVEDLIRPDDFEAYLGGGSGRTGAAADDEDDEDAPVRGEAARQADYVGHRVLDEDDDVDEEDVEDASVQMADEAIPDAPVISSEDRADDDDADDDDDRSTLIATAEYPSEIADAGVDTDDTDADESDDDSDPEAATEDSAPDDDDDADTDESDDDDAEEPDDAEEAEASEGIAPAAVSVGAGPEEPTAVVIAADGVLQVGGEATAPRGDLEPRQASGRRRRRRRRKGGGKDAPVAVAAPTPVAKPADGRGKDLRGGNSRGGGNNRGGKDTRGGGGKDGRGNRQGREARDDRGRRKDARISRSVPITEVVKEGDEVVVQVSKEPIGTKGARVTSHVSLPGRHVVYLPTVDHIGVSKRIGSARERTRLREVIESIKPPKGGLIVRTVAEGLTKKQLKNDIGYLVKVWEELSKKHEGAKAPSVLYTELDLVLKVARDLFTDEIERIVIDDREQYGRLVRFIEAFMPERAGQIELYQGDEPIFDAYGIEDEIGRALSRKVPLSSGGYLIIDQAEALTAIDVNTGRFVGKGSRDLEETAMKTNLEAVDEIAYQLRFRNIGGLVILDLIDMERHGNREQVWRALEQRLVKDKAKTTLNRISELGLVEMTRKRTRESLGRVLHEPCFYCDGTGQIQSRATIAYEILRQIRRDRASLPGYSVVVNAHPAVVDFMSTDEKAAVEEAGRRFQRRIVLNARPEYHIEQFDLQGK